MRTDVNNELVRMRSSATQPGEAPGGWPRAADRLGGVRSGIESISVQGFRSINRIQELELHGTNVIIGANGSGKSNFLNVFSFLRLVSRSRLRYFVQMAGGADSILHFGRSHTPELECRLSFRHGGERGEYSLQLEAMPNDFLTSTSESISFGDSSGNVAYMEGSNQEPYEAGLSVRTAVHEGPPGASNLRRLLDGCQVFQFSDVAPGSGITLNPELSDNRYVHADGSNVASYLFLLQQRHIESYEMIRDTVRRVAACFDDFVLEPITGSKDTVRIQWKFRDRNRVMDVSALSDGVVRFIALATVLLQPAKRLPSAVLLDEPEIGLDHLALRVLGDMIETASKQRQVIVATQSAALLDALPQENVLMTELRDGETHIGRLELDRLDVPLAECSLGELWQKGELGRCLGTGEKH